MDRKIISSAAFFGMTAIILGAFGAHALKKVLTIDQLATFETGVKYQFYHAFALILLGFLGTHFPKGDKSFKLAGLLFFIGIILFSGSLYLLSTQSILNISIPFLGPITPIGGSLLIFGWLFTALGVLKK